MTKPVNHNNYLNSEQTRKIENKRKTPADKLKTLQKVKRTCLNIPEVKTIQKSEEIKMMKEYMKLNDIDRTILRSEEHAKIDIYMKATHDVHVHIFMDLLDLSQKSVIFKMNGHFVYQKISFTKF